MASGRLAVPDHVSIDSLLGSRFGSDHIGAWIHGAETRRNGRRAELSIQRGRLACESWTRCLLRCRISGIDPIGQPEHRNHGNACRHCAANTHAHKRGPSAVPPRHGFTFERGLNALHQCNRTIEFMLKTGPDQMAALPVPMHLLVIGQTSNQEIGGLGLEFPIYQGGYRFVVSVHGGCLLCFGGVVHSGLTMLSIKVAQQWSEAAVDGLACAEDSRPDGSDRTIHG